MCPPSILVSGISRICSALRLRSEVSSTYTSTFVCISLLVLKTQILLTARADLSGSASWFWCRGGGSALACEEPPPFLWLQNIELLQCIEFP